MFGNNGGNKQPISDGLLQFAGWIAFAVLAFFFLSLALDFIQTRTDPSSINKSAGAEKYFARVNKGGLVKALIGKRESGAEDESPLQTETHS